MRCPHAQFVCLLLAVTAAATVVAGDLPSPADSPSLGWDRFAAHDVVLAAARVQDADRPPSQIEIGGVIYERREKSDDGDEGPENISDNSFLLEEAYNQEPGVAQHIFNWIYTWDGPASNRHREFAATYSLELPIGSQQHQFSFITLFRNVVDESGGVASEEGGVGDTFLSYRYQLWLEKWGDPVSVAPRFSVLLPSGDAGRGLGFGEVGYQFDLPLSKQFKRFDVHFNAGFTSVPGVKVDLGSGLFSSPENIWITNLGGSVFWKPQTYFHVFLETLLLFGDELDNQGLVDHTTQVILNPGFRYALCQLDDVEWVVGASVPVGVTPDAPDIGVFLYMSVEHRFAKKSK